MRNFIILFLFTGSFVLEAQEATQQPTMRKGRLNVFWGWNRSAYGKSDIKFKGHGYDFTLKNVRAKDRQSPFTANKYFNPTLATIPQYNFRIGYVVKDNLEIAIGVDHMKYVAVSDQILTISGEINTGTSPYDGNYNNDQINMTSDFLGFEHTDGLNYISANIYKYLELIHKNKIVLNGFIGTGTGILIPKTNTTLLNMSRYDEFHLSGFGFNFDAGLNLTFFDKFFIQTQFKTGYINMPDIKTSENKSNAAKQSFMFYQHNLVIGGLFNLCFKKNKSNLD